MPRLVVPRAVDSAGRRRPVARPMDGFVRRTPAARPAPAASSPPVASPARQAGRLPALAVAATVAKPEPIPAPPLIRAPLDMDLPGANSAAHFNLVRRQARWRGLRRGLAMAMVLLMTFGGLLFSQSYLKLHQVFKGSAGTAAALKTNVNPNLLKGEGRGRINILLLGRGGGNHDGPDLTDSMMLVSVDPVNHTSSLLSLPRDLWVNAPNRGVMKLNAVWETGEFKYLGKIAPGSTDPKAISAGFDEVDQTVGQVLGITVDYNVLVDFQAFQQAVDAVGGVTVNVPADLVDPTMAWENHGNPVLATAGTHDFNGKQALIYVRSRETSSDFARGQRQRSVLLALKDKTETLGTIGNPLKVSGLFNAFGNNVQTDLSLANANRLFNIVRAIQPTNMASLDLDGGAPGSTPYVTEGNLNGQSIVLPKAGLFQYDDIQKYVRGQLKDPYLIKENARIMILNGTSTPGLASSLSSQLQSYGYNIVKIGNTSVTGWTGTTLVDLTNGKDKYTKHYLEQRFGVTATGTLSDKTIPTAGADFVIIIGSNEANPSQT